jgi:hypothetical protein
MASPNQEAETSPATPVLDNRGPVLWASPKARWPCKTPQSVEEKVQRQAIAKQATRERRKIFMMCFV